MYSHHQFMELQQNSCRLLLMHVVRAQFNGDTLRSFSCCSTFPPPNVLLLKSSRPDQLERPPTLCTVFVNMSVILKRQYFFCVGPFECGALKKSNFMFPFFVLCVVMQHEFIMWLYGLALGGHDEVSFSLSALLFAAVCLPLQFVKLTRTLYKTPFYA